MCNCALSVGSFSTETQVSAIYEHSVYTVEKNQIHVRAFQVSITIENVALFPHLNRGRLRGPFCGGIWLKTIIHLLLLRVNMLEL